MSIPDKDPEGTKFRPEFVDGIVEFFGEQFDSLSSNERAHAIGVVANTLAALAMNQIRAASADSMRVTLDTLSVHTNRTVESLVSDESVGYLYPQSLRICEIIRDAISKK